MKRVQEESAQKKRAQKLKAAFEETVPRAETTILCIDQSYAECGLAVFINGRPVYVDRLNFDQIRQQESTRTGKKYVLRKKHKRKILSLVTRDLVAKYNVTYVIAERVRTFSAGNISLHAIIALGELIATIIDAIPDNIPVLSVDTRAWKHRSVQNASATKEETIIWALEYLKQQGLERTKLTDNEADTLGMGEAFYQGVSVIQEE